MTKKNARTRSAAATLASVKKEMAKPRVAESARPDTHGGRLAVFSKEETARRAETEKVLLDYGKKVGS
jgi:hypothetical protein